MGCYGLHDETELTDNYTNESRLALSKQALFCKQGDVLYTIIYGQLSSNVIPAATNPDYKQTHKDCCVISILEVLLLVCIKNISGTKVDPLYDALQIFSSTLSYTQKKGVSNSNFGDAINDQV